MLGSQLLLPPMGIWHNTRLSLSVLHALLTACQFFDPPPPHVRASLLSWPLCCISYPFLRVMRFLTPHLCWANYFSKICIFDLWYIKAARCLRLALSQFSPTWYPFSSCPAKRAQHWQRVHLKIRSVGHKNNIGIQRSILRSKDIIPEEVLFAP